MSAQLAAGKLLEGKVIIVTGSGQGVGQFIAEEAVRLGAKVVINDVGKDEQGNYTAQLTADRIVQAGGAALASLDSVAEKSSAEKIIQLAMDNWGRIDGLVNNAGILRDRIFHKMSEEEWDQSFQVNVKGCFNMARGVAPIFKERQGGAMIHMTSTSGLIGNFGQANYAAGKMALVGLSKAIALDMARFNVRSNCIAPFALTPLVAANTPRETEEDKARWEYLKRMAPEKIAPLACGLLSDAGANITGQIFGARANEIFLFSQPRPLRTMHIGDAGGITTEAVIERVFPAFESSLYPLDRSLDVFTWNPM